MSYDHHVRWVPFCWMLLDTMRNRPPERYSEAHLRNIPETDSLRSNSPLSTTSPTVHVLVRHTHKILIISWDMIIKDLLFHYCGMFPNFPTFGFSSIFCFSGPLWHPTDLQICQLARHPSSLPEPRLSDASGPFGAAVETPAQWRGDEEGGGELSRSLGGAGNWQWHFEF